MDLNQDFSLSLFQSEYIIELNRFGPRASVLTAYTTYSPNHHTGDMQMPHKEQTFITISSYILRYSGSPDSSQQSSNYFETGVGHQWTPFG